MKYLVLVIVLICLGICFFFFISQSSLIYSPLRMITATPSEIGLEYEDVRFKTKDNLELSGWFVPCENNRGVVLFCHGNAGNISSLLETIEQFNRLRLSVFVFDYRGYGESQGKPTEQGTYLDAEAAWDYLTKKEGIDSSDIIIIGRSLGGAVASYLAILHTPRMLIIESAFTSIDDIGRKVYPYLPVSLLSRFHYNVLDYVKKIKCPILVVHSKDDEMIPFSFGKKIFEAAKEPKAFLEIFGTHNDGFLSPVYEQGLNSFISKWKTNNGKTT